MAEGFEPRARDASADRPPLPDWNPNSWHRLPALQQAVYPDPDALQAVLGELAQLPPLVTSWTGFV